MTTDSRFLQAPPDQVVCRELLKRSEELLAATWDQPLTVGLNSPLLVECEAHLQNIRRYATPQALSEAHSERDVFLSAMRKAWFAVWMARDYSIDGWRQRLSDKSQVVQRMGQFIQSKFVANRHWLLIHAPVFDRDGKIVGGDKMVFPPQLSNPDWSRLLEGSQILSPKTLRDLREHLQQGALRWVYVAKGASPAVPWNWPLEDALCEELERANDPERNSALSNSIVMGRTTLANLGSVDFLRGARFESGLTLRAPKVEFETPIAPSMFVGETLVIDGGEIAGSLSIPASHNARHLEIIGVRIQGDIEFSDGGGPLAVFIRAENNGFVKGGLKASRVSFSHFVSSIGVRQSSEFSECRFLTTPVFLQSQFNGLVLRRCEIGREIRESINFSNISFGSHLRMEGGSVGLGADSRFDLTNATAGEFTVAGVNFNCTAVLSPSPDAKLTISRLEGDPLPNAPSSEARKFGF